MKRYLSSPMVIALTFLAGAWSGLAIAIGSQLPTEETHLEDRVAVGNAERWRSIYPLMIHRPHPCNGSPVTLQVTLVLDVIAVSEGENAQVSVWANLTNDHEHDVGLSIVPIKEQFGFLAVLYGRPSLIRELHTPIGGGSPGSELIVPIEQGLDGDGRLQVMPSSARLNCTDA